MLLAKIENGEIVAYPCGAADVRADHPETCFSRDLSTVDLPQFGWVVVEASAMPEPGLGEIVEEGPPELVEGQWRQSWAVSFDLGRAKDEMRSAVNVRLDAVFQAGFTPASGPLEGHTLQTRDVVDRTNWLTSQAAYSTAVAMGQGAAEGASFRTAANVTVTTTYAQGLAVLLAMAEWGKAAMGNSWALKDAIEAAGDAGALAAIDIEEGWPE